MNIFSRLVSGLSNNKKIAQVEIPKKSNYTTSDFLDLLRPYNIFHKKRRLGPNEDGGYVCSQDVLENCSALFTYGVGGELRYEKDFVDTYLKPAYLFDHTNNMRPFKDGFLEFFSEGLGSDERCKDFLVHANERNILEPVLLKIDIEGAEYRYFKNIDILKLKELVMGLIIEVHWLESPQHRESFINIVNILDPYFILEHVHGNVWGGEFTYEGENIPSVLELSYVNRNLVKNFELDIQDYPIVGLDYSNNPNKEDIKLNYINKV